MTPGGPAGRHVALLVLAVFVPTAAWAAGVQGFTILSDELTYVREAVHIADTGTLLRPGDPFYNSWAQLTPLLWAPLFAVLDVPAAVVAVHVLGALALASGAIPACLLARDAGASPGHALSAGALATVTAWLAFAGTVMTEVWAMPLALWTLWAIHRAVVAPSLGRDVLVLALCALSTFNRVQLVVLAPVFVAAVLVFEVAAARSLLRGVGRAGRRHRELALLVAAALAAGAALWAAGPLEGALGGYRNAIGEGTDLGGALGSAVAQLAYVVLATGALAFVLGGAWAVLRLAERDAAPGRRALAALVVVTVPLVALEAGLFATENLTTGTTGRYVFYVAPPAFVALVLALQDGLAPGRVLAAAAGVVALVALALDPSALGEAVTSAENDPFVGGAGDDGILDGPVVRIAQALLVLGAAWAVWRLARRRTRPQLAALVVVPTLLLGLATFAYRARDLSALADTYASVEDRTWIDDALPEGRRAVLVPGPVPRANNADIYWTNLAFWNKQVRETYPLPTEDPDAGPATAELTIGELRLPTPARHVVVAADDPRFALRRARRLAAVEGAELLRAGRLRLRHLLRFTDSDGTLRPGTVPLHVWGDGRSRRVRVEVDVAAAPTGRCPCRAALVLAPPRAERQEDPIPVPRDAPRERFRVGGQGAVTVTTTVDLGPRRGRGRVLLLAGPPTEPGVEPPALRVTAVRVTGAGT